MSYKGFVLVMLALASPTAALAQVNCGDTVRPGETVVLTDDLLCPGTGPALTIEGPATLNLNGFKIQCQENSGTTGLLLIGRRARVMGAYENEVQSCAIGIHFGGDGRHTIEEVSVAYNQIGIGISSDRNTVQGGSIWANAHGIIIDGDRNKLYDLRQEIGLVGLLITGSRNRVERSLFKRNDDVGVNVRGDRNLLRDNNAREAGGTGFSLQGARNTLKRNLAERNGHHGFYISFSEPGRNRIIQNRVFTNGSAGILTWTSGNRFTGNTALYNDTDGQGFANLQDETGDCSTNRWRNNSYTSSNVPCIR